jgi:hypothetical protein
LCSHTPWFGLLLWSNGGGSRYRFRYWNLMNNRSCTSSRTRDVSWLAYLILISSQLLKSRRFKRRSLVTQGKQVTNCILKEDKKWPVTCWKKTRSNQSHLAWRRGATKLKINDFGAMTCNYGRMTSIGPLWILGW